MANFKVVCSTNKAEGVLLSFTKFPVFHGKKDVNIDDEL